MAREGNVYARVATFEGDPARIAEGIAANREMIESTITSPPKGLEGVKGVWMLVDRARGRGLGITLFETEEELQRGDEALNRMSPPVPDAGRRTGVEVYEVAYRRDM
jgi:hypothetical protein